MASGMVLLEARFETLLELLCGLKLVSENVCELLEEGDDEAEAASALRGLVRAVVKEAGAMAQEAKIIRRGPQVAQPAPAVMQ